MSWLNFLYCSRLSKYLKNSGIQSIFKLNVSNFKNKFVLKEFQTTGKSFDCFKDSKRSSINFYSIN